MTVRLSPTVLRYVGRQFLVSFGSVYLLFIGVIFVLDTIELMRRASGKEAVTFGIVVDMALLKLPLMAQEVLPFAVLFGSMFAFWRLNRSSELVVIRSFGLSVWQFLLPVLLLAAAVGIFRLAAFNPLAAIMVSKFEQLESSYLRHRTSVLAVSRTGLWLRQRDANGQSVVHAAGVSDDGLKLSQVIIFFYEDDDRFVRRADAKTARLETGHWRLQDAWITGPDANPRFVKDYRVETDLTLDKIQESFASPETISFWELPRFIRVLEAAGFSSVRHRLHFHSLLAEPLLLCAMALVAAVFSLRHNRRTGGAVAVAGGVATGFLLYFLTDVISALGLAQSVPVLLAAWTPAGASTLFGLAMLFHLEDG